MLLKAILSPVVLSPASAISETFFDRDAALVRACSNAVESCRVRATFLWNALLTSDTASDESRAALLKIIPSCYRVLIAAGTDAASDGGGGSGSAALVSSFGYNSADLREKTLTLLSSAMKIPDGATFITSFNCQVSLPDILKARLRVLTSATVALRRRLADSSAMSETGKEELQYDVDRNDGEVARLQALRRAMT